MVPEKWEPGQRAAVVKHKDNLVSVQSLARTIRNTQTHGHIHKHKHKDKHTQTQGQSGE